MLWSILDGEGPRKKEWSKGRGSTPTLAAIRESCLRQLGTLRLSAKEYTYLKGTLLFNSDVIGVGPSLLVQGLQLVAQKALQEVVGLPQDAAAGTLRAVSQDLVTELFFKPIIGKADQLELLDKMLFAQHQDLR